MKLNKNKSVGAPIKHGGAKERLYHIWNIMRQRCLNIKNNSFKNYGGRGITICPEWTESYIIFRDWALSNGYKENLQINRINNDGNYEPNNCEWITRTENMRNTRKVKLTIDKVNELRNLYYIDKISPKELSKKYSISRSHVYKIINNIKWG